MPNESTMAGIEEIRGKKIAGLYVSAEGIEEIRGKKLAGLYVSVEGIE